MKVTAAITKHSKGSTRTVEKAKTSDEIEWTYRIATNTLDKLYVSQLNLYLVERMGYSKTECDAKGFTKSMKIQQITQHFFKTSKQQPTTSSKVPRAFAPVAHVSLPNVKSTAIPQVSSVRPAPLMPASTTTSSTGLRVPPWGGAVLLCNEGVRRLTNTCPIDNYLTILYVLMVDHKYFNNYISNSVDNYAAQLVNIKQLFSTGYFADGKLEWLQLHPGCFNLSSPTLDLWGNEEELSLYYLESAKTSYRGVCSSTVCPHQTKDVKSNTITLR